MRVALTGLDAASWGVGIPVVPHADGAGDMSLALVAEASRGVAVWLGMGFITSPAASLSHVDGTGGMSLVLVTEASRGVAVCAGMGFRTSPAVSLSHVDGTGGMSSPLLEGNLVDSSEFTTLCVMSWVGCAAGVFIFCLIILELTILPDVRMQYLYPWIGYNSIDAFLFILVNCKLKT